MKILRTIVVAAMLSAIAVIGAAAADKTYTVGVTVGDMGHPGHIRVWKTLQERADELGLKLIILDDKRDLATEASNIDTLLTQKVDGVLIMGAQPQGSVRAAKRVQAAGIPILAYLDQVDGIPYVGSDHKDGAGAGMAAEYMAKKLNGKGNVVYIRGGAGTAVQNLRDIGFREVIKKYPGIKVIFDQNCDWSQASGAKLMSDALVRFPNKGDIDAVFTHDDAMTIGALQIAKEAGRAGEIQFYGTGGYGQNLDAIKAGEQTMSAFQDMEMIAIKSIEAMYRLLHGEKVDQITNVDWLPVDSSNVQTFLDRFDPKEGKFKISPEQKTKM
jgi:ABC-type sugar transport system substrate-binding protein